MGQAYNPALQLLTIWCMWTAVYEHLVFEGYEHLSIRSLPGMAERTLRIGSAGKTFSLTAWKVCARHSLVSEFLQACTLPRLLRGESWRPAPFRLDQTAKPRQVCRFKPPRLLQRADVCTS